jgi:hypothetical protein
VGASETPQHRWIRFWRTLTNVSRKHLKSTSPSCQRSSHNLNPSSTACATHPSGHGHKMAHFCDLKIAIFWCSPPGLQTHFEVLISGIFQGNSCSCPRLTCQVSGVSRGPLSGYVRPRTIGPRCATADHWSAVAGPQLPAGRSGPLGRVVAM